MGCVQCPDGSWECSMIADDLCEMGDQWDLAGTFCLKILVRKGKSGKCQVRLEPYVDDECTETSS